MFIDCFFRLETKIKNKSTVGNQPYFVHGVIKYDEKRLKWQIILSTSTNVCRTHTYSLKYWKHIWATFRQQSNSNRFSNISNICFGKDIYKLCWRLTKFLSRTYKLECWHHNDVVAYKLFCVSSTFVSDMPGYFHQRLWNGFSIEQQNGIFPV